MRPAGRGSDARAARLITCVVQDADTGDVLMVAWADAEALEATRATGLAHFHSPLAGRAVAEGRDVGQHDGGGRSRRTATATRC